MEKIGKNDFIDIYVLKTLNEIKGIVMMMDDCILQYYSQGLIAPETAVAYAHDPVSMASRVHLYY